jgi:hypothetical protein
MIEHIRDSFSLSSWYRFLASHLIAKDLRRSHLWIHANHNGLAKVKMVTDQWKTTRIKIIMATEARPEEEQIRQLEWGVAKG